MEKISKTEEIEALKKAVEEAVGMKFTTDPHFQELREIIFKRTGSYLSATTLKRLWGYLDEPLNPRDGSLSLLARSIGYTDWSGFLKRNRKDELRQENSSSPEISNYINVTHDLKVNDELLLYWYPERECKVRYLGELRFEVIEAKNTKLMVGDRFTTPLILPGHPLYLSNVERENMKPMAYICGKLAGGVNYRKL